MVRTLIVEDSPTQAQMIQFILEDAGHSTELATNGAEGLEAIASGKFDIVLTDLQMPVMNGLELVESVRQLYPGTPVVLMTAHGSEAIAVEALHKGAAGYVPKRALNSGLVRTVRSVLDVSRTAAQQRQLADRLAKSETVFVLENDPELIPPLIGYVNDTAVQMHLTDDTGIIRIGIALREAVSNAIEHGNLEVSGRREDPYDHDSLLALRRRQEPFSARKVEVKIITTHEEVTLVVRDQGPGFDYKQRPSSAKSADLDHDAGRGLVLMHTFMDEVTYNDQGNEVRMVKLRESSSI